MKRIQLLIFFVLGIIIPTGMVANAQFVVRDVPNNQNNTSEGYYVPQRNNIPRPKPKQSYPNIEGYEYLWDITALVAKFSDLSNTYEEESFDNRVRCSLYGRALGSKVFYLVLYEGKTYHVKRGKFYVDESLYNPLNPRRYKFNAGVRLENDYSIGHKALFFNIDDF